MDVAVRVTCQFHVAVEWALPVNRVHNSYRLCLSSAYGSSNLARFQVTVIPANILKLDGLDPWHRGTNSDSACLVRFLVPQPTRIRYKSMGYRLFRALFR